MVGQDVPWHGVGMGAHVARVKRRGGRWTRVLVEYQTGCLRLPLYPGQPEEEWNVPGGRESISREDFEKEARGFAQRRP